MRFLFFLFLSIFCLHGQEAHLPLIPSAQSQELEKGHFQIGYQTAILASRELQPHAEILASALAECTSLRHRVLSRSRLPLKAFNIQIDPKAEKKGYHLSVTPDQVHLKAHDEPHLAYGLQTLIRLLPPKGKPHNWIIPCVKIHEFDQTITQRALLINIGSHLFPVETMKLVIDRLAALKMNTIIIGFNSANGWRLESKVYPGLTEIGSLRPASKEGEKNYSGYYTQEMVKELLKHAQQRKVRLIPCFDFHEGVEPILRSIPELKSLDSQTGETFLNQFFVEISKLFPEKVIYFVGKEEMALPALENAIEKVKITPLDLSAWYTFDFSVWQHPPGLVQGKKATPGLLTVSDVYHTQIPKDVPGVLATLDTAQVPDPKALTYTLFPRLAAMAEITWAKNLKYEDFKSRWKRGLFYYKLRQIETSPIYDAPVKEGLHGTIITSTIEHHEDHWPELAFDGRSETWFESGKNILPESYIQFQFPVPITGEITIKTGGILHDDHELEDAVLESSSDGKSWQELAEFFEGELVSPSVPAQTRYLRIRITAAQDHPFAIHEINLSEAMLVPNFKETRNIAMDKVNTIPISFVCDFSEYPELRGKIGFFRNLYFKHYRTICDQLYLSLLPKTPITAEIKLGARNEEMTLDARALATMTEEEANSFFLGLLVKHIARYHKDTPHWFSSGIVSMLQYKLLDKPLAPTHQPLAGDFNSGAFLHWFQEKYSARLLGYLSKAARDGQYRESIWPAITEKSLKALISSYQSIE